MIWLGIAIVLGTFWLIYKNFEARLGVCVDFCV